MPGPRIEPSSDHRQLTAMVRQMYLALIEQGFREEQALTPTAGWWQGMASASNPAGERS